MDSTPHETFNEDHGEPSKALTVLWGLALALLAGYFIIWWFAN